MKGGYPLRPLLVPALLAVATALALLGALLSDGALERASVAILAAVVGLVGWRLIRRN